MKRPAMPIHPTPPSVLKPVPPPLWYVTNGEVTVGPVFTGLLRRGVEHGRVPEYCRVSAGQDRWRHLLSVREIAALYKGSSTADTLRRVCLTELEGSLASVRDEEEICYHVTRLALIATGAESGMFHMRERSSRSLATRCVLGPLSDDYSNHVLPEEDLVLRSARVGRPVLGPPYGPTEDALAIRFASSTGGVGGAAMIPIFVRSSLWGMLELSRPGHAFRSGDLQRAERIAQRALYRHVN
jgi:hypothetical protein